LMASANTRQKGSIIGKAAPCQQTGGYVTQLRSLAEYA
jgi:hypothetical protein